MDERERVLRVAQGDRAAFRELAQRYLPVIERYILRLSGNRALAEDIAQETLLKLWEYAGRFDPERGRLATWLHRMAHNLLRDDQRRGVALARYEQVAAPVTLASEEASNMIEGRGAVVAAALMALPEAQRSALILTYYQELTNREVSQILGVSVRALESLLVRARAALKRQLGVTYDDR